MTMSPVTVITPMMFFTARVSSSTTVRMTRTARIDPAKNDRYLEGQSGIHVLLTCTWRGTEWRSCTVDMYLEGTEWHSFTVDMYLEGTG